MTRRLLLRSGASFAAVLAAGCAGLPGLTGGNTSPVTVFKRSGRNRNVSNAAKKHNANRLYATAEAAQADLAHPGDQSKVVQITLSRARFDQLFPNGNLIADLRHL